VLPAPLIIFSTFVGYIAGGLSGALLMTLGIFIPAFVFPIFLHRYLVAIAENPRIRPFLLGVTAGVIGLIASVTVQILDTQRRRRLHGDSRRRRVRRAVPLPRQAHGVVRRARLRGDRGAIASHRRLNDARFPLLLCASSESGDSFRFPCEAVLFLRSASRHRNAPPKRGVLGYYGRRDAAPRAWIPSIWLCQAKSGPLRTATNR
jgi:Chromate transporter